MRTPRLSAAEVLARLHLTRQVLVSVHAIGGPEWRSGQEILRAIAALEQYAARRLHRPEIAAYARDIEDYARYVLGELLIAKGI